MTGTEITRTEITETTRVGDLRVEIGRVREALERADAVLGAADHALDRAERAVDTGRRVMPVVLAVVAVAVVGGIALTVLRKRRSHTPLDDTDPTARADF